MSTAASLNGVGFSLPQAGETGWQAAMDAYLLALSKMRGGQLVWGVSTGVTSAARYAVPGHGAAQANEIQISAPATGTLRGLFAKAFAAPVGDTVTITVRKAGAASAMTCVMAVGATTASDTSNTLAVTAGDALSISVTGGASFASGCTNLYISTNLTPS